MDKVQLRDLLWALKAELIRFRFWFVVVFVGISFTLVVLGCVWSKSYSTSATLYAENTVIIDTAKKNTDAVKVDRIEQARQGRSLRILGNQRDRAHGMRFGDGAAQRAIALEADATKAFGRGTVDDEACG